MKLTVEKAGLGYRALLPAEGIGLYLDRINESRSTGDVSGELTVARAPEGHLVRSRFNLVSMTARASMARHLDRIAPMSKNGPAWLALLERYCIDVLDAIRAGEPLEMVGDKEEPAVLDYLLEPLIVRRKETILFGAGGIGKSTLSVAAGVSLQTGVSVFPGWKVREQTNVMICDYEDDASTWNGRIRECSAGAKVEPPALFYQRMRQPLHAAVNDIATKVSDNGIGLLIIDSVTRAMPGAREGGDASDAFKRMWDAINMLAVAVLLIDHQSKGGEEGRRPTPYGSVMKENWVRSMYELREDEQDDRDVRHLVLFDRKQNHKAKADPVGIKIAYGQGAWSMGLEQPRLGDERAVKDVVLWMRVRTELGRHGKLTIAELVDLLGLEGKDPERRVRMAMDRKVEMFGKVEEEGLMRYFLLATDHVPEHGGTWSAGGGGNIRSPYSIGGGSNVPPPDTRPQRGPFDAIIEANEEREQLRAFQKGAG